MEVPWYWIPISLCGGAAIGFLVVGLLLASRDENRVVARWKGSKGTELIDTSDGFRWQLFARPYPGIEPPAPWPHPDETFERVA